MLLSFLGLGLLFRCPQRKLIHRDIA